MDTKLTSTHMGIRYKILKSAHVPVGDDGAVTWFIEYLQNPKRSDDWAHRGTVLEKDGKFFFGGEEFVSPLEALRHRLSVL
jgi:hypothetical protein